MAERYDPFANVTARAAEEPDEGGQIMVADMVMDGLRALAKPLLFALAGTIGAATLGAIFLGIPFWWTVTACIALIFGGGRYYLNSGYNDLPDGLRWMRPR